MPGISPTALLTVTLRPGQAIIGPPGPAPRGSARQRAKYVVARFCPLERSFLFAKPSLSTRGTSRTSRPRAFLMSSARMPSFCFFTTATTWSSVLAMSSAERRERRPFGFLEALAVVPRSWRMLRMLGDAARSRRPDVFVAIRGIWAKAQFVSIRPIVARAGLTDPIVR